MKTTTLQYPIGQFEPPKDYSTIYLNSFMDTLASFPEELKAAVILLTDAQLDTTYRPDGWTIRQVVHHCADSHLNFYIRLKWTLTEDTPTIKFYHEDRWGKLPENCIMNVAPSLQLLEGLHQKICFMIEQLDDSDFQKCYIHPEYQKKFSIQEAIALYAWHCRHHLAHIKSVTF